MDVEEKRCQNTLDDASPSYTLSNGNNPVSSPSYDSSNRKLAYNGSSDVKENNKYKTKGKIHTHTYIYIYINISIFPVFLFNRFCLHNFFNRSQ